MAQTVHIEYFGMPGSGPTLKEARADAGRKLERAMKETYRPRVIRFCDHLAIVWREPDNGWRYGRVGEDGELQGSIGSPETLDQAVARAQYDQAQLAWSPEADDEEVLGFIEDLTSRGELRRWVEWQRRYDAYRKAGKGDVEAHEAATLGLPVGA